MTLDWGSILRKAGKAGLWIVGLVLALAAIAAQCSHNANRESEIKAAYANSRDALHEINQLKERVDALESENSDLTDRLDSLCDEHNVGCY